jgi:NitT/TauT family transport system substrate-binding protein
MPSGHLNRAAFVSASAAAFAAPSIARATDLTPITIGLPPSDTAAVVYYAQQLGFFKTAGLDPQISFLNSGPVIASALAGGALNFGAVNVGSIASARLRGVPLRIVAPSALVPAHQNSGDQIMTRNDSKLTPGASFNGKTVAIVAIKTVQHAAFLNWIDLHGGDSSAVKMIEIPFPEMFQAVDSGRVDAAIPVEPFSTQWRFQHYRSLGTPYEGLRSFMVFALAANEHWLAANPTIAAKFALALRQAAVWANSHPKESRELLPGLLKVDQKTADAMLLRPFGTTSNTDLIAPVIDIMLKYHFIDKPIAPADLLWQA